MAQYNNVKVKLSNLQLNKSKIRNITLNLQWSMTGESNYNTNFPHKLLLTDR